MRLEKDFFMPFISANLANTEQKAKELQQTLDEFMPTAKVTRVQQENKNTEDENKTYKRLRTRAKVPKAKGGY